MRRDQRIQRVREAKTRLLGRPYDWAKDCAADVARRSFPAVAGRGRGEPLR